MVEVCPIKVRKYLSLGGPLTGESKVPFCESGVFCWVLKCIADYIFYNPIMQRLFSISGYWRAPYRIPRMFKESEFLPLINNQGDYYNETFRENFMNLEAALFLYWTSDSIIKPREAGWWMQYDEHYNIVPKEETELYKKDLIGLRALEEMGRVKYVTLPGEHMDLTTEQVDDVIIPFLLA